MATVEDVSTKLAALILLKDGEITFSEIEALPFVEDKDTALVVAGRLLNSFDVEIFQRKTRDSEMGSWDDVIRLRRPPNPKRTNSAIQNQTQSGNFTKEQFESILKKVARLGDSLILT